MQSKGWIRLVAILLAVASLWQLSFTAVTAIQEKKAEKYAEKAVQAAQATAAFAQLPEDNQAFYLDSIRKEQNRYYIDSISDKKVYLWDTYKDVKAKEINLGLDLKGGMNVMLQVQLQDLVKALAGGNTTPEFLKALDLAKERSVSSREDYISLFAGAWSEVAGGARLSHIFGTYEMKDKIKPESTDAEVISVIRSEAESAIANSFNVLRNRIDRFGVTQPSIQKLGNSGRILVELPGVKEPERVRKLLQGTASLEFWETFNFEEIYPYLIEANAKLAEIYSDEPVAAPRRLPGERRNRQRGRCRIRSRVPQAEPALRGVQPVQLQRERLPGLRLRHRYGEGQPDARPAAGRRDLPGRVPCHVDRPSVRICPGQQHLRARGHQVHRP